MTNRHALLWLLLILLLAAGTRFHAMDSRSLWEDEGWTLLLAAGPSPADIVQTMAYDQHSPLYFVLMRPWIDLTGESEFALRAFSAFWGILSIAVIYQLGRITFIVQVGLLAAVLLAVWDFPIDLSQDARQYSMLLFFVILSCACYLRYLKSPTRLNGLGWWASSVIGLYAQYTMGVVLIFQLLHMLIFVRPWIRLRDLLIRLALIGAAFLPWLPVFIRQNQVRWDLPLYYQSGLPNNHATYILVRDAVLSRQSGLILGLMLLGLVAVSTMPRLKINWKPQAAAVFMALWFGLYVALIVLLNERREILRIRLFIVVVPPALILAARGLTNLGRLPGGFLLAVLLAVNLTTVDFRDNKPPWREVTQNVTDFHQAGEPILMDIWVGDFSVRYYVRRQMGADTPWRSLRELRDSAGDLFLPELAAYVENRDAFWLIRWNDDPQDYDGLLAEMGFQRTASAFVEHVGNRLYSHRYDRLTDERNATFGGMIDLLKASVTGKLQPGAEIEVALWWATREPLPLDYSISLLLADQNGAVIGNQDSAPVTPTGAWQPDTIYYDRHHLIIPSDLPAGEYIVGLRIYWYAEPGSPLDVTQENMPSRDYAVIERFEVRRQ